MDASPAGELVDLDLETPVRSHVFTIFPLVVVGTKEADGDYDLAPKRLAMPLGWDNYFAFVCTPRHATYRNALREGAFTVSYPRPTQIVTASLAASSRASAEGDKPVIEDLETFHASRVDALLLRGAYLFLECELHRMIGDLGG